jgi:hypothetical protein
LTSLASNAVATVVMSISENACDRETLMRTLDGKPSPVLAPTQSENWDGHKVTEQV